MHASDSAQFRLDTRVQHCVHSTSNFLDLTNSAVHVQANGA